ncbi:MAG: hypothetical protein H7062_05070 [Candidatus Saccharimonas sp.]|nr:hypothetical protein [Planctomycetaceae bacterium]
MLSLLEVEAAAEALPPEQQRKLLSHLAARLGGLTPSSSGGTSNGKGGHSVLDIPTLNLGGTLRTSSPNGAANGSVGHSVLDIPPVSVGSILRPFSADDDLLEEMLEGRHL